MLKYKAVSVVLSVLTAFSSLPVLAEAERSEGSMQKLGEATYRFWGFRLYDASFYTGCPVKALKVWNGGCEYRLDLHYKRAFRPEDFRESSEKILRRLYESDYGEVAGGFNTFQRFFENVDEGDTYTLTYTPDGVISLSLNGVSKGKVHDANFAKAYFQIWLAENGIDRTNSKILRGMIS